MNKNSPIVHDTERAADNWSDALSAAEGLPVLDRAYRAVIVLLLESGLRGLSDVKTADIATLSNINESTLFRYAKKRDVLVADAVDWCWEQVNQHIAATHHASPKIGSSAAELILTDLDAFLALFDDVEGKLVGTGAMLSFRRAEQLTEGSDCPHQMAFRTRLATLTKALVDNCPTSGQDSGVIATYLTNYVSTVWFTWLADPSSREPQGFLDIAMVRYHISTVLERYASCTYNPKDIAAR